MGERSVTRPVEFNLSHTPGMIVLAVAKTLVGVVSSSRRDRTPLEVAERFFSPAEAQASDGCRSPIGPAASGISGR
jgi:phosphopantetheinyl transferase